MVARSVRAIQPTSQDIGDVDTADCTIRVGVVRSVLTGPDEAVELVSTALSVKNPKAKYSRASKFGWDGSTKFLRRPGNSFETGLLARVQRVLQEHKYRVALVEPRETAQQRLPLAPPTTIEWRPYQLQAFQLFRTLPVPRLILQCPTGGGKTKIGVEMARQHGGCVLWVVPTQALLRQTLDQLRESLPTVTLGVVGDGEFQLGEVTVGLTASLKNSVTAPYFRDFDMLIEDECFPGSTMVGNVPISSIQVGDVVPAWYQDSYVMAKVTHTMRSRALSLVRLTVSGEKIVCTPNHPILTETGWVAAGKLCAGSVVLCWTHHDSTIRSSVHDMSESNAGGNTCSEKALQKIGPCILLRDVSNNAGQAGSFSEIQGSGSPPVGADGDSSNVHVVWRVDQSHNQGNPAPLALSETRLLQRAVSAPVVCTALVKNDGRDEPTLRLPTNAGAQPNEVPNVAGESFLHLASNGPQAADARGQRETDPRCPASTCQRIRLASGSRRVYGAASGFQGAPQSLQGGCGEQSREDRDRSGRREPRIADGTGPGQAERRLPERRRVDSVEVLEPGRDGTFGGVCPDGYVYNLEVERAHTYIVGLGLIVHNCHHASAATWLAVAKACVGARTRLGLSGTAVNIKDPVRALHMEGALGPIVVLTDTTALTQQGYLARATIRFVRPPASSYPSYEDVREIVLPDWKRDPRRLQTMGSQLYGTFYERGITTNRERNARVLRIAMHHAKQGHRVLVLCRIVEHARALHDWWSAVSRQYPCWQLDRDDVGTGRAEAVLGAFRAATTGALLIATPFFREGVDLPEIDAFVNAAGGKSEVDTLQALGRALRPRADKTTVDVYDFADGGAPTDRPDKDHLALHTLERVRLYREQGHALVGAVPGPQ